MAKTHVIDGVTYVEVDRKAEVGDKVSYRGDSFDITYGKVYEITGSNGSLMHGHRGMEFIDDVGNTRAFWTAEHYRVLEPVEDNEVTEASPDVLDLLTSLSRKFVSLESQLRDTQGNVEKLAIENAKLAQELANTRHRLAKHADRFAAIEDKVEMLTDDIVTLDDRSQVLNAINKYYAEGSR